MKIQDVTFLVVLAGFVILRKPRLAIVSGIISLLLSMPLFHLKIALFTAQRLVMYAAAFFLVTTVFYLLEARSTRN